MIYEFGSVQNPSNLPIPMKQFLYFYFLILIPIPAFGESNAVAIATTVIRNRSFESLLMLDALERAKDWKSSSELLPLSPEAAKTEAVQYLKTSMTNSELENVTDWLCFETALTHYPGTDKWYYCVDIAPGRSGSGGRSTIRVYVLLSGEVIPVRSRLLSKKPNESEVKTEGNQGKR